MCLTTINTVGLLSPLIPCPDLSQITIRTSASTQTHAHTHAYTLKSLGSHQVFPPVLNPLLFSSSSLLLFLSFIFFLSHSLASAVVQWRCAYVFYSAHLWGHLQRFRAGLGSQVAVSQLSLSILSPGHSYAKRLLVTIGLQGEQRQNEPLIELDPPALGSGCHSSQVNDRYRLLKTHFPHFLVTDCFVCLFVGLPVQSTVTALLYWPRHCIIQRGPSSAGTEEPIQTIL